MIIVMIIIAAILCIAFPAQILASIFLGIMHPYLEVYNPKMKRI